VTLVVPSAVAVKLTEQLPALSVQLALVGVTPPLGVKVTVPVGVVAVPGEVSVTDAVQLLEPPVTIGLSQLTLVADDRLLTVIEPLPVLVPCVPSPA
jgi:hypothetical protein